MKKNQFLQSNKGEINPAILVSFSVLLLVITIGGVVLQNMQSVARIASERSVTDNVQTPLTNVTIQLPIDTTQESVQTNEFFVENQSGTVVGSGNYSVTAAGVFTLLTSTYNNTNLNLSFNVTTPTLNAVHNVTTNSLGGVSNLSSLTSALGIVIISVIIIGTIGTTVLLMRR